MSMLLRRTWRHWRDLGASRRGAGLAFYALFALAPLWVLSSSLDPALTDSWGVLLPETVARTTDKLARTSQQGLGTRSAILAGVALVYAPLRGFLQLQATLNEAWGIRATRGPGPLEMVRRKAVAFASVLTTVALLALGVWLNGWLLSATDWAVAALRLPAPLRWAAGSATTLALLFVLLAVVYKYLADAVVQWRVTLVGAAVSAVLLLAGREAISAYLAGSSRTMAFGGAGAVIAVLLFAYYAAQVFLLGASFTWVYAEQRGVPIEPGRDATRI